MKSLNDMVESFNEGSSQETKGAIMFSYDNEAWLYLRGAILDNALSGILISMAFALIVLILTSQNLLVSLISIGCICQVILSLVGAI
jgi:tetrahydromethanopterin S-methyltransferase subunit B